MSLVVEMTQLTLGQLQTPPSLVNNAGHEVPKGMTPARAFLEGESRLFQCRVDPRSAKQIRVQWAAVSSAKTRNRLGL